ncbi:MAG: HypC/HybG/HupF family hydrogenase formation chaperone [Bacteroidetes bacterium]|nr:HypC/HybG/HupF family hydrogenase formation chaperone [Bacteroidota bacterium]
MCLAIPGKVLSINQDDAMLRMGKVSFAGVVKDISLQWVPEAVVGDYVLVHVGFALNIIDQEEAEKTLELLRELGEGEVPQ